ncbi:helix-turn-helix transcriptional regulator [Micromonospora sp. NPDC049230]|uniref:PadR family transcriptional regulator n=1 Tax=Micromonospora sp. NPDC049230 TaxID=3155502 RepID=UPI003411C279
MARKHDLVGLTVLAVLSVRESHPYELHQFIVRTHKDYVTGLPRSLYHAVDRLSTAGLIEPSETVRDGRRPERTVYRITDGGRRELMTQLGGLIERPQLDRPTFSAAVSLLGSLPVPAAREALRARASAISETITTGTAQLGALRDNDLPDVVLLKLEYELATRQAELDWIGTVLARFDSGALDWPDPLRTNLLEKALHEATNETEKRP